MSRTYTYDQFEPLERSDPSLEICTGRGFYPRRTYVRNRCGQYVKIIRIINYSSSGFYYLCEHTLFGRLRTFLYNFGR